MDNEFQKCFTKYIKLDLKTIYKDKTLSRLSAAHFFDIFVMKFLGKPEYHWYPNSREIHYIYNIDSKEIEVCVLIDFKEKQRSKIELTPEEREIIKSTCATIFINSERKTIAGGVYLKLFLTKQLLKCNALLRKREELFDGDLYIPFENDFYFGEKEIDLRKIPNKILDKTNIEFYLSATFSTLDIFKFEILDKEIYICEFEDEFVCASKIKNGNYCLWVPFIPNEKNKEESEKIIEKIKHRIKMQEDNLKKGLIIPIFKVKKSDLPLPQRPIENYSYLSASVGDKSTARLAGK
ncbi:MAG: hypothetical protein WC356_05740 [Candidatus Micrarchaeia archaeon]|jgi:hypothetical protein